MDFSKFFIDRPIFAVVLSIILFAVGLVAIPQLPVGEYPEVVPPSVVVRATYPGANPKEIAESVAVPLEEAINGVEGLIYLKSVAASDGSLQVVATFRADVDPDTAAVRVQNRVSQAQSRLPEEVRQYGVTTQKRSSTPLMYAGLTSSDGNHDALYLRNHATLKIKDELARIPGIGEVALYGAGDYAMRVWLDPSKVAARQLTAAEVIAAIREQNVQVSAGQLGAEPSPKGSDKLLSINVRGRLKTAEEFGSIVLKGVPTARSCACPTWRASNWAPATTACARSATRGRWRPWASSCRRAPMRWAWRGRSTPPWSACPGICPKA